MAKALRTPHQPYHTVSLYWHFVDVVWVFIVVLLYVIPIFRGCIMVTNPHAPQPSPQPQTRGGRRRSLWFGFATSAVAWVSLGCLDLVITWRACTHQ